MEEKGVRTQHASVCQDGRVVGSHTVCLSVGMDLLLDQRSVIQGVDAAIHADACMDGM